MIQLDVVRTGPGNARILEVKVRQKIVTTPTYYPAISKKEIRDPDDQFLDLVATSQYPRLLVSAYDYGKTRTRSQGRAIGKLRDYYNHGSVVMLDSGVFEAYWRENRRWEILNYRGSVKSIDSDFFLSFDILPMGTNNRSKFRKLTEKSIDDSVRLTNQSHCIPIVHESNPVALVSFVSHLTRKKPATFSSLAVSERELGRTISERCDTITRLRKALDKIGKGLLHILGCGQPISMASYVYCGADSFDSLDWARAALDPVLERLIDLSHFELLGCKCEICRKPDIDPYSRAYLHNLLFYQRYSAKLQMMIRERTLVDYLQTMTDKTFVKRLSTSVA